MQGNDGKLYGSTYSPAPGPAPWELRAKQIDIDTDSVFHDATLRVGKVPLLYVLLVHVPIDSRRQPACSTLASDRPAATASTGASRSPEPRAELRPDPDAALHEPARLQLETQFRYLLQHGRGSSPTWLSDDLTDRGRAERSRKEFRDNRRVDNRGMFRFTGTQDLSGPLAGAFQPLCGSTIPLPSRIRATTSTDSNPAQEHDRAVRRRVLLASRDHRRPADPGRLHAEGKQPSPGRLAPPVFRWGRSSASTSPPGVDAELVRFQHNARPARRAERAST